MKHSLDELIKIAHHYYPQGRSILDPGYRKTKEYRRFLKAYQQAGEHYQKWHAMIARLAEQFPQNTALDHGVSLMLAPGLSIPQCAGMIMLPERPSEQAHLIEFRVSILAPYYKVYSRRIVDDLSGSQPPARTRSVFVNDTCYTFPAEMSIAEVEQLTGLSHLQEQLRGEPPPEPITPKTKSIISFEMSPEEEPYRIQLTREIEATFAGYEAMPPSVGNIVVPDIATRGGLAGKATLYDCLLWDH